MLQFPPSPSEIIPRIILPPPLLLRPRSPTLPHRRGPYRPRFLRRCRRIIRLGRPERIPEISALGLEGFGSLLAAFVYESVEGFRAGLDALADCEGGLARLGGEVCFCYLCVGGRGG